MKIYRTGSNIHLTLKLFDSRSDRYVQAKIYGNNMTLLTTENLTHVSGGLFSKQVSLDIGSYTVIYSVFLDSSYLILDRNYSNAEEMILIDNVIDKIDDNDGAIAT